VSPTLQTTPVELPPLELTPVDRPLLEAAALPLDIAVALTHTADLVASKVTLLPPAKLPPITLPTTPVDRPLLETTLAAQIMTVPAAVSTAIAELLPITVLLEAVWLAMVLVLPLLLTRPLVLLRPILAFLPLDSVVLAMVPVQTRNAARLRDTVVLVSTTVPTLTANMTMVFAIVTPLQPVQELQV
jgi:hypothetical protein